MGVEGRIPDEQHPSDHVPVVVKFQAKADHKRCRECAAAWLSAVTCVSLKVPVLSRRQLEQAFDFFAHEGEEYIDDLSFEEACVNLRAELTYDQQRLFLMCFGGLLSRRMFTVAYELQLTPRRMQGDGDVERAFQVFSGGNEATLTAKGFRTVFAEVSPTRVSDEEVFRFVAKVPTDAEGYIDVQVFTLAIMQGLARMHSGDLQREGLEDCSVVFD